jgi:hypothetical protein
MSKNKKVPVAIQVARYGLVGTVLAALIGFVGVLLNTLANQQQTEISTRGTQLALSAEANVPVYINIVKELQLLPNSISDTGYVTFKVDETVTARLELKNTGPTLAKIARFVVAVRGPNACDKGWSDKSHDFLGVAIELLPNEVYSYVQDRSFDEPGVYFAEAAINLSGRAWGGVHPLHRIHFLVVGPNNENPSSLACVTPIPSITP